MTARQIKFLTLIFALVNVWLLFHIPSVSEATLKFISVGEIPGTTTSLSPDTMLYLAIGSFAVSVVLIFWREFRKLFRRRKPVQAVMAVAEVPATPAPVVVVATPPVSRRTGKKPPVVRPQVFVAPRVVTATLASAERRTSKLFTATRSKLAVLAASAARLARRGAARIRTLAISLGHWLVPQAKHLWALLRRLAKASWLLALDLWHWLEPHIRRCDRWLERQLRRHRTSAEALKVGSTVSATVAVSLRKLSRTVKNARDNARKAWRTTNN